MATTKQLAERLGVHVKTIRRRIFRDQEFYEELAGGFFEYHTNDELPEAVAEHLTKSATQPGEAVTNGAVKQAQKEPATQPQGQRQVQPQVREPKRQRTQAERNKAAHEALFSNTAVLIIAAAVLIAVDAISFGWIAFNTYPSFYRVAVPIFALSGMAVGFSAFKSILAYKGWNGDGWMFGFGLFQLALHLCAMQALGELSFFFGKIVISIGLPLASAGLALALKNGTKEE